MDMDDVKKAGGISNYMRLKAARQAKEKAIKAQGNVLKCSFCPAEALPDDLLIHGDVKACESCQMKAIAKSLGAPKKAKAKKLTAAEKKAEKAAASKAGHGNAGDPAKEATAPVGKEK